jgi:hypothetical protein
MQAAVLQLLAGISETSVSFYHTTQRNIPEESHLHKQFFMKFHSDFMKISPAVLQFLHAYGGKDSDFNRASAGCRTRQISSTEVSAQDVITVTHAPGMETAKPVS